MQCERSWRRQPRTAPLYVLNVPDDTNPTALITTSAPRPLVMAVPYVHTHHRNKKLCYRRRTSQSESCQLYKQMYNNSTTNRSNGVRGLQLINVNVNVSVNVEFKVTLHEQVHCRRTLQY